MAARIRLLPLAAVSFGVVAAPAAAQMPLAELGQVSAVAPVPSGAVVVSGRQVLALNTDGTQRRLALLPWRPIELTLRSSATTIALAADNGDAQTVFVGSITGKLRVVSRCVGPRIGPLLDVSGDVVVWDAIGCQPVSAATPTAVLAFSSESGKARSEVPLERGEQLVALALGAGRIALTTLDSAAPGLVTRTTISPLSDPLRRMVVTTAPARRAVGLLDDGSLLLGRLDSPPTCLVGIRVLDPTTLTTRWAEALRCSGDRSALSAAVANLGEHQSIRMKCYLDDTDFSGLYSSPRWFLTINGPSQTGWVHSSYVQNQKKVNLCSQTNSTRGYVVADYAQERIGAVGPEPSDLSVLPPGWNSNWAGYCYGFVYAMWAEAGKRIPIFQTAAAAAQKAHLRTSGIPPVGALVYFTGIAEGHVAVSSATAGPSGHGDPPATVVPSRRRPTPSTTGCRTSGIKKIL
jgi:hypothetical protein